MFHLEAHNVICAAKIGLKHPDPVVETSSLSSVEPPDIWYNLSIPEHIIDYCQLSALQLETIVYSSQKHETFLPSGERAGFLVGQCVLWCDHNLYSRTQAGGPVSGDKGIYAEEAFDAIDETMYWHWVDYVSAPLVINQVKALCMTLIPHPSWLDILLCLVQSYCCTEFNYSVWLYGCGRGRCGCRQRQDHCRHHL